MATTIETAETRLIFTLEADGAITKRTISMPGTPSGTTEYGQTVSNWQKFRNYYTDPTHDGYYNFVQPSNWRDTTDSTSSEGVPVYRTTEIELEFYEGTRTRYTAEDVEQSQP